jgi:hypothetical protein
MRRRDAVQPLPCGWSTLLLRQVAERLEGSEEKHPRGTLRAEWITVSQYVYRASNLSPQPLLLLHLDAVLTERLHVHGSVMSLGWRTYGSCH